MISANSYVTSPVVKTGLRDKLYAPNYQTTVEEIKDLSPSQLISATTSVLELEDQRSVVCAEVESEDEVPEWLRETRRKLIQKYIGIADKNSHHAFNVLTTLRRVMKFKVPPKHTRRSFSRISSNAYKRDSSCPRCSGFGMGQFRHVQNGVCFCCGKLP